MSAPRTAIIGAGWSGLQIAAVLRDCGHDVRLFEQLDDVGGTWHPDRAYAGLAIHTPAFRCQFHGFDGWADRDRLARLPAADVFANCRAFADAKQLRPLTAFRQRVSSIRWDPAARVHHVTTVDTTSGTTRTSPFDIVISTQFNEARVPSFPGQESFTGDLVHSSAVREPLLARLADGRSDVVLVGGSKAAADIALLFVERGIRFRWLLRRMYWFLSFDRGYRDTHSGRPARRFHRLLYFAGLGLARGPLSTRLVFRAWRLAGLLQCPGRTPADVTAFHHGWLDAGQIRTLRTRTEQVYGECARLAGRTLHTTDGRTLPCDLLVCATGCDPVASPIDLFVDDTPVRYEDVELVYRMSVIPELPRLIFTGYSMFGFGPLNGFHRAAWILRYLEQDMTTDDLRRVARADADPTFMFRRGSFLFDGSRNLLTTVKAMNRRMGEGIYDYADLKRHYRDIAVNHRYAPLAGAARFVEARRRQTQ